MAIAETARLITQLSLQDQLTPGLAKARTELSTFSGLSGKASTAMSGLSNAAGTFKSRIGGLLGATGLVGLGAGLFSVERLMSEGISTATTFGDEVRRLAAVTGLSAAQTSALASAFDHFNIDATQAQRLMGFLEKNVGNLSVNTKAETKFTEDFGFSLRNTSISAQQLAAAQNELGDKTLSLTQKTKDLALIHQYFGSQIKDANQLILEAADYFNNKAIPAQIKAAALAKLFGRSWQDLIPILKAGRQGIQDAEEEAAKLGLTLTQSNLDALIKLKNASREWGTALAGLKLQIGLALVPALTDLATAATKFLANGGRDQIVNFFKQLVAFGRQAADTITGQVIPVFKAIYGAWMAVPKEVRDLLITGLVANKTIKFLFGVSPLDLGKGLLGTIGQQFFSRGSPVNPMSVIVMNPGFGLPGAGGAGGLAGAGDEAGGLLATFLASGALPLAALATVAVGVGLIIANTKPGPWTPKPGFNDPTDPNKRTGGFDRSVVAPGSTAITRGPIPVTVVGSGAGNLAHGFGQVAGTSGAAGLVQTQKLTSADWMKILGTTPFIGPTGYKSVFEKQTTEQFGRRDPTGQQFLALVQKLDNPKAPAVLGEIKGHLSELQNLEAYYIAHGDTQNALKVQGVINEVRTLIGITGRDSSATHADNVRIGQEARANHVVSSAGFREMKAEQQRTTANTGIVAKKNFSPSLNATVNVASTNTFNVNSLATSLVSTYTRVNVGNQYQGKVVPI